MSNESEPCGCRRLLAEYDRVSAERDQLRAQLAQRTDMLRRVAGLADRLESDSSPDAEGRQSAGRELAALLENKWSALADLDAKEQPDE